MSASGVLASDEFTDSLRSIAARDIGGWTSAPVVLEALRHQNTQTEALSVAEILSLDATWRDQTVTGGDLIDELMSNPLSVYLKGLKSAGKNVYTEVFIADARGLNVGQSDVTSDYWQGDEAKWQVPFQTEQTHFGGVEFDESTQTYQSQISVPIFDNGSVIGVITVGVDLEHLFSH